MSYDFKESLGDGFGGFVNGLVGAAKEYGEYDIRIKEVKNAAKAQYGNDQTPEPVHTNGAPVTEQASVMGVKSSTLMVVGMATLAMGGAFFLYKQA